MRGRLKTKQAAPDYADAVRIENGFEAPLKVVSEANQREHWNAKYKRKKEQQAAITAFWRHFKLAPPLPCRVVLTRLGKQAMDSDNLAGAFKHVQDAIAKLLKVDDGDVQLVSFEYRQVADRRAPVGIRVEIFNGEAL